MSMSVKKFLVFSRLVLLGGHAEKAIYYLKMSAQTKSATRATF